MGLFCCESIVGYKTKTQKITPWLPSYLMELFEVPTGIDIGDLLPLFVELNLDDFKITKTVVNKPTPLNLVFKGIPFEQQEKMKNIFLLGNEM